MKKTGVICRMLCVLLSILIISVPVLANDTVDMSVVRGCHSVDAQVPMLGTEKTINNVYSAFLYDYTNDVLLFTQNPDQQYHPASLVKILTAFLIVQKGNLDDQVTVRQDVLDTIPKNSRALNFQDGEIVTLRDLLYATLVQSANEAAAIAADYISGSQEIFVSEMNAFAAEIGCKSTNFVNVHGLHDDMQISTARDLARILSVAAKDETFMEVFSTVNYTIPATNFSDARALSSNNYLMNDDIMTRYLDSRVTGGRAGVMDTGEHNLAVTAEYKDVKLVSVVIGSLSEVGANGRTITYGSFQETSQLLDMGFKGYHSVQLFYKDQVLKQYDVINGESFIATGVRDAVLALLPQGVSYEDLSYRYNEDNTIIRAPVKEGDVISTVQVWHEEICLAQANLYALHDVNVKNIVVTEEIIEETETDPTNILIIVAVIVGLLILLLIGRRLIFRFIRRQQIRRHRRNRRRSR